MKLIFFVLGALIGGSTVFCQAAEPKQGLSLTSPAFQNQEKIPLKHTCKGENRSPELNWKGGLKNVTSFCLICRDLDALNGNFIHWIIYNIPADETHLSEAIPRIQKLKNGSIQGMNSFQHFGYDGPCPPPGKPHRYLFTLYALDTVLNIRSDSYENLKRAMQGHIVTQTDLIGVFGSGNG